MLQANLAQNWKSRWRRWDFCYRREEPAMSRRWVGFSHPEIQSSVFLSACCPRSAHALVRFWEARSLLEDLRAPSHGGRLLCLPRQDLLPNQPPQPPAAPRRVHPSFSEAKTGVQVLSSPTADGCSERLMDAEEERSSLEDLGRGAPCSTEAGTWDLFQDVRGRE